MLALSQKSRKPATNAARPRIRPLNAGNTMTTSSATKSPIASGVRFSQASLIRRRASATSACRATDSSTGSIVGPPQAGTWLLGSCERRESETEQTARRPDVPWVGQHETAAFMKLAKGGAATSIVGHGFRTYHITSRFWRLWVRYGI